MRSLFNQDDAFTGLEAAIVLIAFIVVAAVFSYVVLGAGFFTTQKSQEVVHSGMQQASSSLEVIGQVYGVQNDTAGVNLSYVQFDIGNTAGGTSLDISQMVVSYIDENTRSSDLKYVEVNSSTGTVENLMNEIVTASQATNDPFVGAWGILETYNANNNTLLEPGEKFTLAISVPEATASPNTKFTINLQPAVGAVFGVTKTVPAGIYGVNVLR